jgi:DNA polymerase III delta prime subunit
MPPDQASLPLTERLRPSRLADILGNSSALKELSAWADAWNPGRGIPRHRAALLEGRPGVGKTTAAWALAHDRGWTVVEMNASEARNKGAIEQIAGRASLSNAFSGTGEFRPAREGGRTLILLDEADCLSGRATEERAPRPVPTTLREFLRARYGSVAALAEAWGLGNPGAPPRFEQWGMVPATGGRGAWTRLASAQRDLADWRDSGRVTDHSDRGGLSAIAQLVRSSRQPVILTVNDADRLTRYSPVFRQGVTRVRFDPVEPRDMLPFLERTVLQEGWEIARASLAAIVERSDGDVRAALTDLDAIAPLPAGAAQLAVLGGRDRPSEFEGFVAEVLSHPRYYRSVEVRDRLDVTPDDLLPWIEENVPHAGGDASHRAAAFELLGRAELMLSRARRFRHYGLWSYASELMTGGVAFALDRPSSASRVPVIFPSFLAGMGRTRVVRALRQSILGKLGRVAHLSRRKGGELLLPFLFRLFDPPSPGFRDPANQSIRASLVRAGRLEAEEVAFLLGVEPESAQVLEELARAEYRVPAAPPPPSRTAEDRPTAVERRHRSSKKSVLSASDRQPKKTVRRQSQKRLGEF